MPPRGKSLVSKAVYRLINDIVVPKEGFEPTRPCGHYALNVARLPFRHFGTIIRQPPSGQPTVAFRA